MSAVDMTRGPVAPYGARPDDTVDLNVMMQILRRQWKVIAAITALFLGLAVVYAVVTPKTWRTSTRVMLDPRDKQLVGIDVNRPQQSVELGWVETRLELVKSFGNLADVVKKEKLLDDAEIMGTGPQSDVPDDRLSAAVRSLAEMLLVERPKENNLLDVTVTSRSPEKAARLSQAVAESFVRGLAQAKVDQVEQAHALLAKQVDVQRKSMLDAEAKVEDYKRANGITVTRGNLVDEETLRQSNENLVTARVKAQEAKERWERLKAVLKSGDPAFHSQIDAVGSAVIGRLKIDAAQAARKKTEIEQDYGPLHPKARVAAAEAERGKALLLDEIRALAATAEMDWQLARANEENVRKNLDRAQSRLSDTTQATVALQELENEANARRDLYKSFVARLQETTLQKSTQVSDATIVSPAQVPLKPFSPRLGLALPLALVAGLGTGISAALYRGRRDMLADLGTARREPMPLMDEPVAPDAASVAPTAAAPLAAAAVAPRPSGPDRAPPPGVAVSRISGADTWAASETSSAPVAVQSGRAPTRVDLTLLPERLARLGAAPGPGAGVVGALTETPDGAPDYNGLAMLRRLGDELGHGDEPEVRVIFSNEVPTLVTAALAHGLARATAGADRQVLLLDLAADGDVLDAAFEAALPMPRPNRRRTNAAFDLHLDDDGVVLARPKKASTGGDPARRADRLCEFLEAATRDHDAVIVHLGCAPAAALLFDIAEVADHMVLVVDEKDVSTRRVQGEIEVMSGLMPHFDGLVVLRVAGAAAEGDRREERRRRRRG